MATSSPKLYGSRQIAIIAGSMLAGIAFYLFRRYHENGRLTSVDAIAAVGTLFVSAIIVVVIVRRGNKQE